MADVYTRIGYIKGATGAQGAQGAKGDTGDAATIEVGTVTTVPYGQTANVVNSGTSGAAVFDFTIPQGRPGEQTTDMQNLTLGSITTSSASFPVPAVGETGKVLWGKVVKWFGDMSALVATKLNISSVVNNLTTTASGYALDARQGKVLNDAISYHVNDTISFGYFPAVAHTNAAGNALNIGLPLTKPIGTDASPQNSIVTVTRCVLYSTNGQTITVTPSSASAGSSRTSIALSVVPNTNLAGNTMYVVSFSATIKFAE